jgi:metal-responsive CopG/Arc/MetJ family transcriptional regulator
MINTRVAVEREAQLMTAMKSMVMKRSPRKRSKLVRKRAR